MIERDFFIYAHFLLIEGALINSLKEDAQKYNAIHNRSSFCMIHDSKLNTYPDENFPSLPIIWSRIERYPFQYTSREWVNLLGLQLLELLEQPFIFYIHTHIYI